MAGLTGEAARVISYLALPCGVQRKLVSVNFDREPPSPKAKMASGEGKHMEAGPERWKAAVYGKAPAVCPWREQGNKSNHAKCLKLDRECVVMPSWSARMGGEEGVYSEKVNCGDAISDKVDFGLLSTSPIGWPETLALCCFAVCSRIHCCSNIDNNCSTVCSSLLLPYMYISSFFLPLLSPLLIFPFLFRYSL